MLIKPADLIPDPLSLDVTIPGGAIDYTPDIRQTGPLHVTGKAERIEEHRGPKDIVDDIRLRAELSGDFELLCARCLEPMAHHANERFDLIFRPSATDADSGERAISEAETEIGYYETSGLLLEDVVREQVLLSLPDRSLCRQDCKGLCVHCGVNLNETSCDCASREVDPRWKGLQGLSQTLGSKAD